MGRTYVKGCFPAKELNRCLLKLGGNNVVTGVRLNTPDYIPNTTTPPDLWPVILEVSPTVPLFQHIKYIYVLQFNVGVRCRGTMETNEYLKALGFNIPDIYTQHFHGAHFERQTF